MAKDVVTVCLPETDPSDVGEALSQAMAPYDINRVPTEGQPWQGEWDWWHVYGGDGDSGFRVKIGSERDPRIIRNLKFPNGETRPFNELRCDGGPKFLLDFESDHQSIIAAEGRRRALWRKIIEVNPVVRSLRSFIEEEKGAGGADPIPRGRMQYRNQFAVKEFIKNDPSPDSLFETPDYDLYFGKGFHGFIQRKAARVFSSNVLLTLDGRWIDGQDVITQAEFSANGSDYYLFAYEYLRELNERSVIVRLRFHS